MFSKPVEDNYNSYGDFVLASLGYALFGQADVPISVGVGGRMLQWVVGDGSANVVPGGAPVSLGSGTRVTTRRPDDVGATGAVSSGGCCHCGGSGGQRVPSVGVVRASEEEVSEPGPVLRDDGLSRVAGDAVPEWRRGPPRGPNFARNYASRQKRKNRKALDQASVEVDPDAELAAKVRRMRLERQEIQEQRKLDKLKSPVQMIEDAMKQVALAEKYAKLANDSKVAEWAAKLSSASAESIALSAGAKSTDVGSGKVSSVGTSYTKAVVDKFSVKKCPMTISEKTAVDVKVVRVDQVESLRRKINRTLTARDFMFADFPHPITMAQKIQIREAEDFCDTENIPIIEF